MISKMKTALFLLILSGIPSFCAEPDFIDAKACNLSNRRYHPFVLEKINEARSSIHILLYLISVGHDSEDKVNTLLYALIRAHKRGVKVKILLEANSEKGNPYLSPGVGHNNRRAALMLRKEGISVEYDDLSHVNHGKAVLIDEALLILGSANWSNAAFESNTETNAGIRSPKLVKEFLHDFNALEKARPEIPPALKKGLLLWPQFLEDPAWGPKLVSSKSKRAFDLYLFLLRRYAPNPQGRLELPYREIAGALDMTSMKANAYRRQINKVLKMLDQKSRLLSFEPEFGKENVILRLCDPKDFSKPYALPEKKELILPEDFFLWTGRLSLRAEYCYLINLLEAQRAPDNVSWSCGREELQKRYSIGKDVISDGMMELRRQNLIEVIYTAPQNQDYSFSFPNTYVLLPIPDPLETEKAFAELEKKFGSKEVLKVRKLLETVFKENDPQCVREILKAIKCFGQEEVEEAFAIVAKKSISNPKRNFNYLKGILANSREE